VQHRQVVSARMPDSPKARKRPLEGEPLSAQSVPRSLGVPEILGVESFGKSPADLGEQFPGRASLAPTVDVGSVRQ